MRQGITYNPNDVQIRTVSHHFFTPSHLRQRTFRKHTIYNIDQPELLKFLLLGHRGMAQGFREWFCVERVTSHLGFQFIHHEDGASCADRAG